MYCDRDTYKINLAEGKVEAVIKKTKIRNLLGLDFNNTYTLRDSSKSNGRGFYY
jgi:hypothetical protein